MHNKLYVLVDCNNFFASCERVFAPHLNDKPLIILSNNDGCVISRSNEAKALGIQMGIPYFKIKEFCLQNNVIILSSNYQLYSDISSRVMNILQDFSQNCEIYSIDEAFLEVTGLENDINEYVERIAESIFKWTGIPVSIGVGSTKTLAKISANIAKKYSKNYFIINKKEDHYLKEIEVADVWGIGKNTAASLNEFGIFNAYDLATTDSRKIYKLFNLVVEKIALELRGFSCKELTANHLQKNITSSRSFGIQINNIDNLEGAISYHVSIAALKLRQQESYAQAIYVYLQSNNKHDIKKKIYYSHSINFDLATNNTPVIINLAKKCLDKIYLPNVQYRKCGIILMNIVNKNQFQNSLFDVESSEKSHTLSKVIDSINSKMGKDTITHGRTTYNNSWEMKQNFLSPQYTSSWKELPRIG